ncbi:MAG: DUF4876 domain-containing protein [Marinifilaceae bacterium]|jgi:hypothetical protein|nr:DUF4876 domain-containing protein [Marinifilaceae bacterium]
MNSRVIKILVIIFVISNFISCKEDDEIKKVNLSFKCNLKEDIFKGSELSNIKVELKNNSTGKIIKKDYQGTLPIVVDEGLYDIMITAEVSYKSEIPDIGAEKELLGAIIDRKQDLKGIVYNIPVNGKNKNIDVELYSSFNTKDFVFSEIYFSGSRTSDLKMYTSDCFFEIYNNSSKVLYADGLCIGEGAFSTNIKEKFLPYVMDKKVVVQTIYQIPGGGKDYPIKPGESILIADQAIDHTKVNNNSVDLSKAQFEWYDEGENSDDIDNPRVVNMNRIYCDTETVWSLNNSGVNSFILFKMDKSEKLFLAENAHNYYYMFVSPYIPDPIKMDFFGYTVKNSLVLDAVTLGIPSDFKWLTIDKSLDIGYTHSGDGDASRYGKSVQRKVSYINEKGRKVLMDTNNSTVDFNSTVVPSPGYIK